MTFLWYSQYPGLPGCSQSRDSCPCPWPIVGSIKPMDLPNGSKIANCGCGWSTLRTFGIFSPDFPSETRFSGFFIQSKLLKFPADSEKLNFLKIYWESMFTNWIKKLLEIFPGILGSSFWSGFFGIFWFRIIVRWF